MTKKNFKTNMTEEASLDFRLIKIDKTRNILLVDIKHNDLMSEKYFWICFNSFCSCSFY